MTLEINFGIKKKKGSSWMKHRLLYQPLRRSIGYGKIVLVSRMNFRRRQICGDLPFPLLMLELMGCMHVQNKCNLINLFKSKKLLSF
jgi:hypothetical protein